MSAKLEPTTPKLTLRQQAALNRGLKRARACAARLRENPVRKQSRAARRDAALAARLARQVEQVSDPEFVRKLGLRLDRLVREITAIKALLGLRETRRAIVPRDQ
jgi:hypothetical protein